MAAAALLTAVACGALLNFVNTTSADASLTLMLLMGVNWLIASLGLVLVAGVARQGPMVATMAYFAGASVRFIGNLLVIGFLVLAREVDILTIFIVLAFAYLPLLLVEAGMIGAYLWRQDGAARAQQAGAHSITEAVA
jgi:hypothetical protein